MTPTIPALQNGDLIYITAPAKAIEVECVQFAKNFLENKGFKVEISEHCLGEHHYFSGTDGERAADFQKGIDNPDVKAILCARGGYGCVRIVDSLEWAGMLRDPKYIIGFSDVTVFHQKMQNFGLESIHASMPLNFSMNSEESLNTLLNALQNIPYSIDSPSNKWNKKGIAKGKLIGGNLSILYSLLGTDDEVDYLDSILFIEDLAEQLYHLDRMFYSFAKAGLLEKIKGLVIGGMTDMKDTAVPFGKSYEEIILAHFQFRKIPIIFDFPAGHIDDNRALIFGREVELEVDNDGGKLSFQ
jgi:muramoyltetrapeptide carboxypeptidase